MARLLSFAFGEQLSSGSDACVRTEVKGVSETIAYPLGYTKQESWKRVKLCQSSKSNLCSNLQDYFSLSVCKYHCNSCTVAVHVLYWRR